MKKWYQRICPHWFGWKYEDVRYPSVRWCRLCKQCQFEHIDHCRCWHDEDAE